MSSKSDRLKKYERELADLKQWLKLGLVPKKDRPRHEQEMAALEQKIEEEQQRSKAAKDSLEGDDYIAPKRQAPKPAYGDNPTLSGINLADDQGSESGFGLDSEATTLEESLYEHRDDTASGGDEYGDMDRARKYYDRWESGFRDPDDDEW